MASIPASNSEQFPSLQSTESLQPAPGQWRKAWSERKEGEEEGKKNNYQRQEGKEKKKIFCKFQLRGGCAWSKRRQADLHETAVQPLAAHPQTTAVPRATALPAKLPALAYISHNKSCPERRKGTNKSKRSSSSSLRSRISEEHHARQIGWGQESSHSHGEESSLPVSCAPAGPAVPGTLPHAPGLPRHSIP